MSIKIFLKDAIKPKNWLKIFGSKMFSTVFYIGYLPEWNRHWSAAFAVLTSIIFIFNSFGFSAQPDIIAYGMSLKFIYIYLFSFVIVPMFRYIYNPDNLEVITIDAYLAQILLFAISIPAILQINDGFTGLMVRACGSFLYCNDFIFKIATLFLTLIVPFLTLRFFDSMEFWPTSYINLYSRNSYFRVVSGLIPAIYASITLYLFCFLFFALELTDVILFYKKVFLSVYIHFIYVFLFLFRVFSIKSFYIFFKSLGLIDLLDKYGLINKAHYDLKFDLV